MADEADLAQAANDEFQQAIMDARAARRAEEIRNLPLCDECEEHRVFVTEKGTITRICRGCYAEHKKLMA